jgi:hypothetical protein
MKPMVRGLAFALVLGAAVSVAAAPVEAQAVRSGFSTSTLAGNDDGSTGLEGIGFTINFFGSLYSNLYINNNGNLTFTGPLSTFTPFPIITTGTPMIAPYFADVDTRSGGIVTYGTGTIGGQNAFVVTWPGVCFFYINCTKTNTFQVVLIDRSDIAAGDFDIEFNYDNIEWETGDASGGVDGLGGSCARAGWTNGSTESYELPGSATCGEFLNGGAHDLPENSLNSTVDGRYVWNVRNGEIVDNVVPEPISIALVGTGLAGIGAARRRRNKREE